MQPIKQNPLSDFAVTDQSLHIDKYMDPEYGVTITNHDDQGRPSVRQCFEDKSTMKSARMTR